MPRYTMDDPAASGHVIRSVRMEQDLFEQVKQACKVLGKKNISEFIREAVRARAQQVLGAAPVSAPEVAPQPLPPRPAVVASPPPLPPRPPQAPPGRRVEEFSSPDHPIVEWGPGFDPQGGSR